MPAVTPMHVCTCSAARMHTWIILITPLSQKLHNVEVALQVLQENVRIPAGVTVNAIVEGHREKTLALLWTIIFHFKVTGSHTCGCSVE